MSKADAINIVTRYIHNLNNSGIPIYKAYLYGSYATNLATESSDIDVLLVSDMFDTTDDVILSKPWSPKIRFDYRIEPIAIGTKKFENDTYSPIIQIVKQNGIEINISM